MWRSLVAWVLVVGLAWSAWLVAGRLYAWEYSVGHFAFARLGAPALYFVLGGLALALDIAAVLALLLPRPRGFGVVMGALLFGLARDLATLRLVSADLDGARRVYAQGGVERGSIDTEATLDAVFSPAGQHQEATLAFLFALGGMALLVAIRPHFEPR